MIVFREYFLNIDSNYLWAFLFVFLFAFIILYLIIKLHWNKFGFHKKIAQKNNLIFFLVSMALFFVATILLLTFENL